MNDDESVLLRRTAIRAARAVESRLLAAFRTTMDVDSKRDFHDVVTAHDKASEEKIIEVILADVPDSTIVGEEGGRRGNGRVEWHIDPIDGTSNFARGIAYWCVSIAAAVDGRVVAGVILNPTTGDLFSADSNGAWLGETPLASSGCPDERGATIVSSFPNAKDYGLFGDDASRFHAELVQHFLAVRSLGSGALNLAHVAAGWADATMGFETNSWDIAAGAFILEQAGGTFHPLREGRTIPVNHDAPDYYGVVESARYPTLSRLMEDYSGRRAESSGAGRSGAGTPSGTADLPAPRGLLLDFGGVVVETQNLDDWPQRMAEVLADDMRRAGVSATVDAGRIAGDLVAGAAADSRWKDAMSRPFAPAEITYSMFWEDFVAADWPQPERRYVAANAKELCRKLGHVRQKRVLRDGVLDLLDAAEDSGVPVGIVSNALMGGVHREWLDDNGLADRFAAQIYSDEVAARKPNPAMIRLGAEAIGIDIRDCWYVGDNFDRDVLCGHRAGVGGNVLMVARSTYQPPYAPLLRADLTVDGPVDLHEHFAAALAADQPATRLPADA